VEDIADGAGADERLDVDLGGLDWSLQKGWELLDRGAGTAGLRHRAPMRIPRAATIFFRFSFPLSESVRGIDGVARGGVGV